MQVFVYQAKRCVFLIFLFYFQYSEYNEVQVRRKIMQKPPRLTVDMPSKIYVLIKIACAELGISMKQFMVEAALKRVEELEDVYLAKKAHEILKDIEEGNEKTITWKEMKKRVS